MFETLLDHMLYLEDRMQKLQGHLTSPALTPRDRELLEDKISLIHSALEHYRQAHDIEFAIRRDEAAEQTLALTPPHARVPRTPHRKP